MLKRLIYAIIAVMLTISPSYLVYADSAAESLPEGMQASNPFYTDEYIIVYTSETGDRANYISDETVSIASNSVGKVSVALSLSTNQTMQKLGFTTLKVQHWNGSSWEDVWTKDDQYSYNTDLFSYVKTLSNMVSNDYYRISVDFYAKKGFLQVQTETVISYYIRCK